jgi:MerR family transcriptional regulator/heat shock protein HspR
MATIVNRLEYEQGGPARGDARTAEARRRDGGDAIQERSNRPMAQDRLGDDDPCYVISIAARMVGMHQQTLRYYERVGLIEPSRSRGNIRLYSPADISRLRQIQRLISDLGVNLAGVEVIIRMGHKMQVLESELRELRAEVEYCRANHQTARTRGATPAPH